MKWIAGALKQVEVKVEKCRVRSACLRQAGEGTNKEIKRPIGSIESGADSMGLKMVICDR